MTLLRNAFIWLLHIPISNFIRWIILNILVYCGIKKPNPSTFFDVVDYSIECVQLKGLFRTDVREVSMNISFKHIINKIKTIYHKSKDSVFYILLALYLVVPCTIAYNALEESDINMVLQFLIIIVSFICFWLLFMVCKSLLFFLFIIGWIISLFKE